MKAYLGTTGGLFALVTLLHVAKSGEMRQTFERDPWFVVGYAALTLGTAASSAWTWRLLRGLPRTAPSEESGRSA